MNRWTALRRAIVLACMVSIVPLSVARAAATPTSMTLTGDSSVYRGPAASFSGQVSPEPIGPLSIKIEQSQDGVAWTLMGTLTTSTIGSFWGSWYVDGSVPVGTRYVRARFDGTADYESSVSPTLTQQVLIHQSEITTFYAASQWQAILPGTDPVRLYARTLYATPLFERQTVDGWDRIDAGSYTNYDGSLSTYSDIAALGEGSHVFRARIPETDYVLGTSNTITVNVTKGATTPVWISALSVQAHHSLPAQVGVDGPAGGVTWDGTMSVKNVATDTVVATGEIGMQFTLPAMTLGPHNFLVSYAGNANYEPSSKTFTVTVVPDIVEATNVGVSATSIYPYVDGYKDTIKIRGTRNEPISVGIRIYNSSGTTVRTASIARATGGYSYTWNGKTSTGAILASGTYKIVQTLTDAFGTVKRFTNYVGLSRKRLYYHTAYVTKLGSSITAKGTEGSGRVVVSTTYGYAKLYTPNLSSWAGVGYEFTIPSATVYKGISFQVYAKGVFYTAPNEIGLQNFSTCPYSTAPWQEYCFDHLRSLGGSSTYWVSAPGSVSANRYGRRVRGMVSVHLGTYYIYKARVKVYYATLG